MEIKPINRIDSGVPRLDYLLSGGFFEGGLYIIQGHPGMGKTILANQCCFHRAKKGENCVYVSLLAETTGRMVGYLSSLSFVDQDLVGEQIHYVSGYQKLKENKESHFKDFIRSLIKQFNAKFLVIDGLDILRSAFETDYEYREFLHTLQTHIALTKCTTLLLMPTIQTDKAPLEHALCDGVIDIREWRNGARAIREVQILKMRGSSYLKGAHEIEITSEGFIIHPRTEVQFGKPTEGSFSEERTRMPFGLKAFDEMLHGGIFSGSLTTLFGTPGTGKTSLGLSFLIEGAKNGEDGIYFGFYETPPRLIEKGESLGLDLKKYVDSGHIELQWQAAVENIADGLAERLLERIREKKQKKLRVFIDGMSGFRRAMAYPERFGSFLASLSNELRNVGATTLFSEESEFFSSDPELPNRELGSVVDNVIFLRYFEQNSKMHRLISILKVRESDYEADIREFKITSKGIVIAKSISGEAILSGRPKAVASKKVTKKTTKKVSRKAPKKRTTKSKTK
jgi:circadian clock protein KaiC